MVWILQVAVSLIFFANKTLVLVGKKSGWLVGAVAAALAVAYFLLIDLYVYTTLELGLVVLMGYGFFKSDEKSPRVEVVIRLVIVVVMGALTYFAFSGLITVVEFASALLMLWGTYLLTHGREKSGWVFYGLAHIGAAYVGFVKDQQFFADFQVASSIVCFTGAYLELAKK